MESAFLVLRISSVLLAPGAPPAPNPVQLTVSVECTPASVRTLTFSDGDSIQDVLDALAKCGCIPSEPQITLIRPLAKDRNKVYPIAFTATSLRVARETNYKLQDNDTILINRDPSLNVKGCLQYYDPLARIFSWLTGR
jgi:hypothetical protein